MPRSLTASQPMLQEASPAATPAPSPLDASPQPPRGSNQGGMRQYNERVVLQTIRLHGALPSAEVARLTRLTAQTVSMISKRLLDDGLLRKGEPRRGKVGQPSVPLSLNPDGAFSIGIKVGRRRMDLLLVDFTGAVRQHWTLHYAFAQPQAVLDEIGRRLEDVAAWLGPQRLERMQGIGIAAPLSLGGWQQLLGIAPEQSAAWDQVDLRAEVSQLAAPLGWPVELMKDTAAACVAELVTGSGRDVRSYLYLYIDTFIGGGLVLDNHLRAGRHGNAGAVGSLPMALSRPVDADTAAADDARSAATPDADPGTPSDAPPQITQKPPQLLSIASLLNLERRWADAGLAADHAQALHGPWQPISEAWLQAAAPALAKTISTAACLLDLEAVIVDGACSPELLLALIDATQAALPGYSWEGVAQPAIKAGTIGVQAAALGGAMLPLYANFAPDRDVFLKDNA